MTISSNILAMLTAQYYHEVGNSILYTLLQSWADMRGLDGTAGFFASQAKGERGHAKMVLNYIHDRNEQLGLAPIPDVGALPDTFVGQFDAALARELLTTEMIKAIREQAYIEGDMMTCSWLDQPGGLVLEQVEEESTIQTILDRIIARSGNIPLDAADVTPAELPGNVIHDIDVWLKARA